MGLLRSRAARQRRSQRHRAHLTASNDEAGDSSHPHLSRSMARHGAGDTTKKTLRKIVFYGVVFCVMQYAKRKKNVEDEKGDHREPHVLHRAMLPATIHASETAMQGELLVMKNVLPDEVARRWQRSLRFEWQKVQNGAWEYCTTKIDQPERVLDSTFMECHRERIEQRNNTLQAALVDSKLPSFNKLSEWRLPRDHYVLKGMEETFWGLGDGGEKGAISEHMEPQLIEFLFSQDSLPVPKSLSFQPEDFSVSHFLTRDFRHDATTHSYVPEKMEERKLKVSFIIFLTTDEEDFNDMKSNESSSKKSILEEAHGAIMENIVCSQDKIQNSGKEVKPCNKKEVFNVSMHFNHAVLWVGNNISSKWRIKPMPWLSEEHGYRVFAVTGSFTARAKAALHEEATAQGETTLHIDSATQEEGSIKPHSTTEPKFSTSEL